MRCAAWAALAMTALATLARGQAGGPDGYRLVWADEFNAAGRPDPDHWTYEQGLELSVDGLTLNTIDLNRTVNPEGREPRNPFHQPHYLLLNLAIGGASGGDPSGTPFPARYEIDYVRVYQKPPAR